LSRRVGGLDTRATGKTLVRMHVAAVPGTIFALAVSVIIDLIAPAGTVASLASVAIGGTGGLMLYLVAARVLKVTEVSELTRSLRLRLRLGRARLLRN